MNLLVRKIDQAKWMQNDIIHGGDISADAITNCSKTTKNTLSTWKAKSEESLDDAVLAIVSGNKYLESIDVVILDAAELQASGLSLINSDGQTPIQDLVNAHVDIQNLTYKTIGKFADHVVNSFKQEKVKRYTKGKLKTILQEAIQSGRLDPSKIDTDLASKL